MRPQAEITIIDQNRQALLNQQCRIKDYQTEAQWQHIVACPDFQKLAYPLLCATPSN